jgi:long-chain fatty acid transport protein
MKNILIINLSIFCLILLAATTNQAEATGFRIPDQSPRAIGQADAFIAQVDDPSAIHYNPAGLVQLKGTHSLIGCSLAIPEAKHKSLSGEREDSLKEEYYPFFAYISSDLGIDPLRFGLGINTPYGMGCEWSKTGFSRYWSTRSEMKLINVNPTIACQITPELSIGVGIDYYYSELINENQVDFGALIGMTGEMDGSFHSTGYGDGWGYNAGLLYRPSPRHSFGVTFRSGADISYHGNARIRSIPSFLSPLPELSTRFSTGIDLPPQAAFGYAFYPVPELKLEIDIDWTGWKTFRQLKVDFKDDSPFFEDQTIEKDWHNAMFYSLGAEYQIIDHLVLRSGLGFMESPIPESTFDTTVVRTKQYAISVGAGYDNYPLRLEFACLAALGEERRIENTVGREVGADLSGYYRNNNYLVSVSGTYSF